MAQPDIRSQIVAGPLQDVSVAFRNKNYIGDRVFPIIERVSPKAKIARYLRGAWFRDEAGIRAAGTRAPRGGYPLTTDSVVLDQYAFAKEVTDEDRRDAAAAGAPPIQPETDAVEFASDKIDLKKEILVAAAIAAASWADGNGAGGEDAEGGWAAGNSNTFLADVRKAVKKVHSECGVRLNKMIIDLGTFLSLKEESTVLDKIKYTERGVLTADLLASLLELDEVLIGDAVKNTAKETKAGTEFTAANIWEINAGKGMGFLFYAPPKPGLKVPSAGYQCRGAFENGQPRQVTTWRENAEHQDVYEVAEETDIVVVGTSCGYLFKDTLST